MQPTTVIDKLHLVKVYKEPDLLAFLNRLSEEASNLNTPTVVVVPSTIIPTMALGWLNAGAMEGGAPAGPAFHAIAKMYTPSQLVDILGGIVGDNRASAGRRSCVPLIHFANYQNHRWLLTDVLAAVYMIIGYRTTVEPGPMHDNLSVIAARLARSLLNANGFLIRADGAMRPIRLVYMECKTMKDGSMTLIRHVAVDRDVYANYQASGYTEETLLQEVEEIPQGSIYTVNTNESDQ